MVVSGAPYLCWDHWPFKFVWKFEYLYKLHKINNECFLICVMVQIFHFVKDEMFHSLNRAITPFTSWNICTITLINIHYLYITLDFKCRNIEIQQNFFKIQGAISNTTELILESKNGYDNLNFMNFWICWKGVNPHPTKLFFFFCNTSFQRGWLPPQWT